MSRKKEKKSKDQVYVVVKGIRYEEFAKVKWAQFLRLFSLGVAVLVVVAGILLWREGFDAQIPVSAAAAVLLVVLAVLAVYRSGIRQEYKRAGLSSVELVYIFDKDGWTVRQGSTGKATVAWKNTSKMRRNQNALLLYPNKNSVNIVPLRCIVSGDLPRIIGFCTGKKG